MASIGVVSALFLIYTKRRSALAPQGKGNLDDRSQAEDIHGAEVADKVTDQKGLWIKDAPGREPDILTGMATTVAPRSTSLSAT